MKNFMLHPTIKQLLHNINGAVSQLVIVCPAGEEIFKALQMVLQKIEINQIILLGDRHEIEKELCHLTISPATFQIHNYPKPDEAARKAAQIAAQN